MAERPQRLQKIRRWDSFLSSTTPQVKAQDVRQLRIDTFQWYFTKRDVKFPLHNNDHYTHLLTRLEARKSSQEKLIYIEMEPVWLLLLMILPSSNYCYVQPFQVSNSTPAANMGSSLVLVAPPPTDEYEGDSDDVGPMSKKVCATFPRILRSMLIVFVSGST